MSGIIIVSLDNCLEEYSSCLVFSDFTNSLFYDSVSTGDPLGQFCERDEPEHSFSAHISE